jgi:hypothetical protein
MKEFVVSNVCYGMAMVELVMVTVTKVLVWM